MVKNKGLGDTEAPASLKSTAHHRAGSGGWGGGKAEGIGEPVDHDIGLYVIKMQ